MLFLEMLDNLQNGLPMRRADWSAEDGYICIMPSMKYVWKIVLIPNPNAGNFIFCVDDFLATDWIEYREQKPIVEAEVV